MSRGTIVENLGEGLYRIQLQYAYEKIQRELDRIDARLLGIDVELPQRQLAVVEKQAEVRDVETQIELLIPSYYDLESQSETRRQIVELQRQIVTLNADLSMLRRQSDDLKVERLSLIKRKNLIEGLPEFEEASAWCADYTLELGGSVGVADVNDEGGGPLIIQPGFEGAADYAGPRDGSLWHRAAMSANQVFFNAAILPGVQKWTPRYRLGQITGIEGDTCSVRLDDAQSSAQDLDINQERDLTEVPIVYMECNGDAFDIGNRVLVRFTAHGPLVVGFESNPVPCETLSICFEPSQHYMSGQNQLRRFWGEPFTDGGGNPINPPLGDEFGLNSAWSGEIENDELLIQSGQPTLYGNRNWFGQRGVVLSWDGPPSRTFDNNIEFFNPGTGLPHMDYQHRWEASPRIFWRLGVLADLGDFAVGSYNRVQGAAVRFGEGGEAWLYVVSTTSNFAAGQTHRAFRIPLNGDMEVVGPAEYLHELQPGTDIGAISGWYFNRSGTKAVCTFRRFASGNANFRRYYRARYDVHTGFSIEQVYDGANQTIGGGSSRFERVYSASTLQIINNQDYTSTTTRAETLKPIYFEYVGEREVGVYLRVPSLIATNNYQLNRYFLAEEGTGIWLENYASGNQTQTAIYGRAYAIVTSDGQTLWEDDVVPNESYTSTIYDDAITNQGTLTLTSNSVSGLLGESTSTLSAIDARFGFCVLNIVRGTQNLSISGSGPWTGSGVLEKVDLPATGLSKFIRQIVVCSGGQVYRETYEDIEFEITNYEFFRQNVQPSPVVDDFPRPIVIENSSVTLAGASLPVSNANILDAASVATGGHRLTSMAYWDVETLQLINLQRLTGYDNVAEDLLQRSGDDYILHRPGLF